MNKYNVSFKLKETDRVIYTINIIFKRRSISTWLNGYEKISTIAEEIPDLGDLIKITVADSVLCRVMYEEL